MTPLFLLFYFYIDILHICLSLFAKTLTYIRFQGPSQAWLVKTKFTKHIGRHLRLVKGLGDFGYMKTPMPASKPFPSSSKDAYEFQHKTSAMNLII